MSEVKAEVVRHHHRRARPILDWQAMGVIVALIVGVVGWGVSVEVRIAQQSNVESVTKRIKNLEELLVPMLVDWKVNEELEKLGVDSHGQHHVPKPELKIEPKPEEPQPKPEEPPKPNSPPKVDKGQLKVNAQRWAEDRVQQRAP